MREPIALSGPQPLRASAAQRSGHAARGVVRFLYTNNPFYVISACLVFAGLRNSFDPGSLSFAPLAVMGALAGYVLLLATAAWAVVRLGNVWQDARSLLLLVVLLLLAISILFDDVLTYDYAIGSACLAGGLAFAIVVSQALLVALRIRLPLLYRVPYHLMLLLFFGYPLLVARLANANPYDPLLDWCLLGFSVAAGLILISLMPAAARGARYVERNGTPWRWAWYPWTVFGVMALAACGRSFYLSVAWHWIGAGTIFAPYFVIPILLAGCLLWLQVARTSRHRAAQQLALAAAAALPALALPYYAPGTEQAKCAAMLAEAAGTPLFLTLSAVTVLFAYAALRRVRFASAWFCTALLALAVVGRQTTGWGDFSWQSGPLLLLGLVQLAWFVRTTRVSYGVAACLAAIAASCVLMRGTWYTANGGFIPINQAAAVLLLFGLAGWDPVARPLRVAAAGMLALCSVFAARAPEMLVPWDPTFGAAYLLVVSTVAWAYWRRVRGRVYFCLAAGTLGTGGAKAAEQLYWFLKPLLPMLDYLLWGALFFALGLLVSALKGGLAAKLRARWFAWHAGLP